MYIVVYYIDIYQVPITKPKPFFIKLSEWYTKLIVMNKSLWYFAYGRWIAASNDDDIAGYITELYFALFVIVFVTVLIKFL